MSLGPKKSVLPRQEKDSPIAAAIGTVDGLLRRICESKLRAFDPAHIEGFRRLLAPDLTALIRHFAHTTIDMQAALSGDEFCLEAYSNFTVPQLKIAVEYLTQIKQLEPTPILAVVPPPRKKRKKKTPVELTTKAHFRTEKDETTGMTSLPPQEIIGATEVWVYHTRTRKLGFFVSKSPDGLSVNGTTIVNHDETRSQSKVLREPGRQVAEFVATFTSEAAKLYRLYWTGIRSTLEEISPRLTDETVIIRAIKPSQIRLDSR